MLMVVATSCMDRAAQAIPVVQTSPSLFLRVWTLFMWLHRAVRQCGYVTNQEGSYTTV